MYVGKIDVKPYWNLNGLRIIWSDENVEIDVKPYWNLNAINSSFLLKNNDVD